MKRSREASCSSIETSSGKQSQVVHGNENAIYPHHWQAAEQYIKAVEEEFCSDRLIQDKLSQLLHELFNDDSSIEVKDVIARVKILFKGHPELIMAFNIFLTEDQKITGKDMVKDYGNGTIIPFEYVEAMSFLNNIKIRFREDENDVYLVFLDILERYRDDNNFKKLYEDAEKYCFGEHPDLLKELTCFISYSPEEDTGTKDIPNAEYESSTEDDMFELDMLVENLKSTRECVHQLWKKIEESEPKDPPIYIKDHLKALNLRCIEYLYGDRGRDVIDLLINKNVTSALLIVEKRLRQKQEEWSTYRDKFFRRVRENNLI